MQVKSFALLTVLLGVAPLAFAAAPEPLKEPSDNYGPYDNAEDQYRYFWSGPWQPYIDIGFNYSACWRGIAGYDRATGKVRRPNRLAARQKSAAEVRAKGYGYAERFHNVDCAYLQTLYPIVDPKGLKGRPYPDMTNPKCYEASMAEVRATVDELPDDPALDVAHVACERRDGARPSFTPVLSERWYRASGGRSVPPEAQANTAPHYRNLKGFPVSRIVDEDDPIFSFYRWYWRDGDNWNRYLSDSSDIYKAHFTHRVATFYDPICRVPPIWGSGGTVTFGSQWVYLVPEPYVNVFSISEQQAMARGRPGQGVWSMIQGITYGRDAAPCAPPKGTKSAWYDKYGVPRYMTTAPDLMRQGIWGIFSRKVDGQLHYGTQALLPSADPKPDRKTGKIRWPDYVCTNTNTYHVIGELFARIGVPLGPLLRAIPERAPEVAFLESFATYVYAHRASYSSAGDIFNRGGLAVRANVQPYVLYEEDLENGGVPPSVKVLLAPCCEVLSKKAFEAIRAWQAKGGVIVADRSLPPALMRDYDFPKAVWTKNADADGPMAARAADELNAIVRKVFTPHANVVRGTDVYTWVRSAGSADYLFVINDRRVRGDYVGQWNILREKGLPNKVTVSLERPSGAVYDLERHSAVPFASANGRTEVDVSLKPSDGAILMAVNAPLKPLAATARAVKGGTEITVTSPDREPMIPIEVTSPALKRPFYGVVKGGTWRHVFPGEGTLPSVRIRNLADNGTTEAAGCAAPTCRRAGGPVRLTKLGTYDIFIVEANPVVFKGRLRMMEYIRYENPKKRYRFNGTGDSYFRFRDMTDMKTFTPSFGKGLHMGNAFVAGDRVVVTAVDRWGGSRIFQMESTDLVHWTEPRVILADPSWEAYNTTLCRAGDRYVLGFELGKPSALVGEPFTMFFAESENLKDWTVVKGARMGADRYTGAPMLRHFGDWFYFFHLEGSYEEGFRTRVMRSKDLFAWELSPAVVLTYDPQDKLIHPRATFTPAELAEIASAADVNASDLDMCEWRGKLLCFYSWGNQRGREYSALATADATEREFCESFFRAD